MSQSFIRLGALEVLFLHYFRLFARLVVQKMPFEKSFYASSQFGLISVLCQKYKCLKGTLLENIDIVYPNCFTLTAVSHFIPLFL